MMGDWVMGTRGMRADVKGVYIGLLIHQYDQGFLPAGLDELALIEPEVGKVWVLLKDKFFEFEPGKLRNKKLEEVREFWSKQGKNGSKGGRPKKEEPKLNPNNNPKINPKHNHHNDIDLDTDIDLKLKGALDEIYIENQRMKWAHVNFDLELNSFREKVRGSPVHYSNHDTGGIRLAFQSQLRNAKHKTNGQHSKNGKQTPGDLAAAFANRVVQDAQEPQFRGNGEAST